MGYRCPILSTAGSGAALEVGPQPHGLLRADAFGWMQEALDRILEWIQIFNSGTPGPTTAALSPPAPPDMLLVASHGCEAILESTLERRKKRISIVILVYYAIISFGIIKVLTYLMLL